MYTSVGSRGQAIAVTGTYLQARAPWTGPGSRPLAVVAPGTQGQADHCASSETFQNLATVRTDPPGVGFGFGFGFGYELFQTYARTPTCDTSTIASTGCPLRPTAGATRPAQPGPERGCDPPCASRLRKVIADSSA